jgi:hypothetical protein
MGMTAGGPDLIQDGLVLCLDASDRNSYVSGSTIWRDLSGNNNSGSLVNGPTFNTGSLGSIAFDGTNDYCLESLVTYNAYSNNFTATAWVKANVIGGGIIGWGHGGSAPYYTWALTLDTNTFKTQIFNGSNYFITSSVVETNKWYNVAFVVYQSGLMELYVNTVKYSTVGSSNLIRSRSDQYNRTIIGTNPNLDVQPPLNGNVANIQIYNRALSAQEVLQNYNSQKSRFGLT